MQDFHLIRASQARPFLLLLEESGAPVERLARQACLPLVAVREQPDGVIGEFALWQFIEKSVAETGSELLGYECAEAFPLGTNSQLGDLPIKVGSTLEQTLEYFNEDVLHLSTASYYSLDRRTGDCWFRRVQAFGQERASWQAELYTIAILLQIIRIHAGDSWLPPALRFSATSLAQALPREWSKIEAVWGAKATGILLPDTLLALPVAVDRPPQVKPQRRPKRPTFRELLATQVSAGCIGLENAALQLGTSNSTLQRHLKASGTTYQKILEQIRHDLACEFLAQTNTPLNTIAETLGYTHLGNFSRAFTRWTGLTPSAYRADTKSESKSRLPGLKAVE